MNVLLLTSTSLVQVLEALLVQLEEQCSWLLETTMAPQSGLHSFDFLGGSILRAVDEQLSSSMPGKSSNIIPHFHVTFAMHACLTANFAAIDCVIEMLPLHEEEEGEAGKDAGLWRLGWHAGTPA